MSSATIANIETGRRDTSGKRRREITSDELVMLADVLRIAPVLLAFPVGQAEMASFTDGVEVEMWAAAKWFGGYGDSPRNFADADAAKVYKLPIEVFSNYNATLRELWQARGNVFALRGRVQRGENGDTQETLRLAQQSVKQLEGVIRSLRLVMRQQGLTPPALPDKDAYLDDDLDGPGRGTGTAEGPPEG